MQKAMHFNLRFYSIRVSEDRKMGFVCASDWDSIYGERSSRHHLAASVVPDRQKNCNKTLLKIGIHLTIWNGVSNFMQNLTQRGQGSKAGSRAVNFWIELAKLSGEQKSPTKQTSIKLGLYNFDIVHVPIIILIQRPNLNELLAVRALLLTKS